MSKAIFHKLFRLRAEELIDLGTDFYLDGAESHHELQAELDYAFKPVCDHGYVQHTDTFDRPCHEEVDESAALFAMQWQTSVLHRFALSRALDNITATMYESSLWDGSFSFCNHVPACVQGEV